MQEIVPVPQQTVSAHTVQPQSTEQAWEMFQLMFAEVVAEAEGILTNWDRTNIRSELAAKNEFSRRTQAYAKKHGRLDVPLCSLGSSKAVRELARSSVLDKLRSSN